MPTRGGSLYSRYLEPVGDGAVVFLLVSLLLVVPFLVVLYRRQGRVDPRSVWVAATFLLFLVCAWALVLLPFPADSASYCATRSGRVQLLPFRWVADAWTEAQREGTGLRSLLTNAPLVVRVFNLLLLLPLGVFLRRWWGRSLLWTTVAAFALSLSFELTQLTGIWGLYPCQYRTFDVDDLVANTAGAMIGWWAAPAFRIVPERGDQDAAAGRSAPVRPTLPRRLLATVVDYLLALVVGGLIVALTVTLGGLEATADQASRWSLPVGLLVVTVLWPWRTGSTPGQWFVLLRVRAVPDGRVGPGALLLRTVVLWGPWLLTGFLVGIVRDSAAFVLASLLLPAAWITVVTVVTMRRADRRGPHELASRTTTTLRDQAPPAS